ncbi:glycosyltransferase family 4 protein [Microbulbifer hydrolyticus]|uniref:Glycosyltransferase n=1 Tax=Microbulbifer hydrolyticus TaxID=48074 RepID=A0A6P1T7S5_9GAMM|nr:glycosyltransferase family 4 protein [Microbulbifer hydrolyticus]MBB5211129.1 glycosyltransferase involved in cell wall biosynthesis [Microbulbifer hydrolyticus]QHQ38087.1 glycosyltransferase [Microbulbifer hydrolyticus]
MKVIQLLPALNAGGVERGTLDMARALVQGGHDSIVISSGGRLVEQLEMEGSRHISLPVHRKSLTSLLQVRPLRRLFRSLQPDIVHVRSRVPAWLTYLAWKKLDAATRPRLVSTAHGLYSINRYSAIMARSEQVIAISDCVKDYLLGNYAADLRAPPEVIYRGVDTTEFSTDIPEPADWLEGTLGEFPELRDRRWLVLPGRLSRWKGQEDFIRMIAVLTKRQSDIQGIIIGGAEKNKHHYEAELRALATEHGVVDRITFAGHRSDIREWYRHAALVYNLSSKPEPFGRTVIEALAMECPVIGYNVGGPAESLHACFPDGLVERGNQARLLEKTVELLQAPARPRLATEFTLQEQARRTLALYQRLLEQKQNTGPPI